MNKIHKETKNYIDSEDENKLNINPYQINSRKKLFHTYKQIKEYLEGKEYKLITTEIEFKNNKKTYKTSPYKTSLIFQDKEGYYLKATINSLQKRKNVPMFHKKNPYTIQNIKLWCKLNNKPFELISDTYEGNKKYLKWECLKKDCGEEFEATWGNISQGYGCSYCHGQKVGLSNCLATKNPELASEWHHTLNGDLTPYDVTCGNHEYVWWQCSKNPKHEWYAQINNRSNGNGCPYCSGRYASEENNLSKDNPELCEEWDYNKNEKRPEEYTPHSNEYIWWICKNNPKHKWFSSINSRTSNNCGCPYCAGQLSSKDYNLLVINPELCEEWDYNKNEKRPEEYTPHSNEYIWWICKECGHNWYARIANRNGVNKTGCPECNKSLGEKECKRVLNSNKWIEISQEDFDKLDDKNKYNEDYFISQKEFDDLFGLGNGLLSYDFYIPKLNLLIEYQGIQHEKYIPGFHKSYEDFLKQLEHDKRKCEYTKKNNMDFFEIWYWDFDRIEEILLNILIK